MCICDAVTGAFYGPIVLTWQQKLKAEVGYIYLSSPDTTATIAVFVQRSMFLGLAFFDKTSL